MVWDDGASGLRGFWRQRSAAGAAAIALALALASCGGTGGGGATTGCGLTGDAMCGQVNPDAASPDAATSPDASASSQVQDASSPPDVASPDGEAVTDATHDMPAGDGPAGQDAASAPELPPAHDAVSADATPPGDVMPDLATGASDAAPAASADFVNYLANAAHTNFVDDPTLVPPLARLWTAELGQSPWQALIAGDLVYVSLSSTDTLATRVVALDRMTGKTAWSAVLPAAKAAYLTYESGRVFAAEVGDAFELVSEGSIHPAPTLWAFDGKTGAIDWQVLVDASRPFRGTPPVTYGGTLYSLGDGDDKGAPVLYAYDEATGAVRWMSPFADGTFAVSADGIFTFDSCGTTTALGLDGSPKWATPAAADAGSCYPFGTAVIQEHTIYETPERAPNICIDARDGSKQGTFPATHAPPVFGAGLELDTAWQTPLMGLPEQQTLAATGAATWTFTGEGGFATAPLVVGAAVYVASQIGTLSAIDPATGHVLWSDNAGVPFTGLGMAAAHGVLVVPADNSLVAYGPGAPSDAAVHDYGGKLGCRWSLAHVAMDGGAASPEALAVADFNKDGKPDLLLAAFGSNNGGGLNVLLGNGDGTFKQLDETAAFPYGTYHLVVGDVDGDGVPDVVSVGGGNSSDNSNIKVSLGKGDGTFKAGATYTVGMAAQALALADLDGNGRADLVVADAADGVRVLLNQGKGMFGAPVVYSSGRPVNTVTVGDLDGDGKTDLVLALGEDPASVQILLGKGNGTFAAPLPTMLDSDVFSFALGDVNGDGKLDLVAAVVDVEILAGKGDGTFAPAVTIPVGGNVGGVALGDVDRDGQVDLVVVNARPGAARILFGAGDGTFHGSAAYALDDYSEAPFIADFNGDGLPDITVLDTTDNTAALMLGACAATP